MRKTASFDHSNRGSRASLTDKRLRAAQARHRYELLQEARLLRDHLAEYWDAPFDQGGNGGLERRGAVDGNGSTARRRSIAGASRDGDALIFESDPG